MHNFTIIFGTLFATKVQSKVRLITYFHLQQMPGNYQMLLGYDPYNSVTRPGRAEGFIGDDYADDAKDHRLPAWASEWPSDAQAPCEPGTQCIDHVHNPLGMLGKWVMQKTAPHYETPKDYYIRHNCLGLPVWSPSLFLSVYMSSYVLRFS